MSLLFHIDNTYVCRELPDLERKLLTFDARNMGITVVGEDFKNLIPEIDIHNINYYDLKRYNDSPSFFSFILWIST